MKQSWLKRPMREGIKAQDRGDVRSSMELTAIFDGPFPTFARLDGDPGDRTGRRTLFAADLLGLDGGFGDGGDVKRRGGGGGGRLRRRDE